MMNTLMSQKLHAETELQESLKYYFDDEKKQCLIF